MAELELVGPFAGPASTAFTRGCGGWDLTIFFFSNFFFPGTNSFFVDSKSFIYMDVMLDVPPSVLSTL
jgi:hypothetical protein